MFVVLASACAASCAKGRSSGSVGGASAVTSSAPGSNPTKSTITSKSASDDGSGNGGSPRSILGCWRLGDQEEWTITGTEPSGARVVRRLLAIAENDAGSARRAAKPADISYDPKGRAFAFSTAGPQHALLFAFTVGPGGLTGSWASSRAPGAEYHPTGSSVTLHPCASASQVTHR
jgi:hypothetical protein